MNFIRVVVDWLARRHGYVTAEEARNEADFAYLRAHDEAAKDKAAEASGDVPQPQLGKYNYFVAYAHSRGHGAIDIHRNHPVTHWGHVEAMTRLIGETVSARHGYPIQKVVILSWRQYDPEPTGGERENVPMPDGSSARGLRLVA
jgi:hypothetical protein